MDIKKVLEMKAKREDARLKAMAVLNKAEAEDRFLSDDEQKEIDKYESEIRSWDESINRAEKMLSMQPEDRDMEKPEAKPSPNKGDEKRFPRLASSSWRCTGRRLPAGARMRDFLLAPRSVRMKPRPRTAASSCNRIS